MINVLFPSSTIRRFCVIKGFLLPLADDTFQSISLDMDTDYLDETRGTFGENAVSHVKSTGNIVYDPLVQFCVTPSPLPQYPDRVTLMHANAVAAAPYGLYSSTRLGTVLISPALTRKCVVTRTGTGFISREWTYYVSNPTDLYEFYEDEYTLLSKSETQHYYSLRSRYWIVRGAPKIDYSALSAGSALSAVANQYSPWRTSTISIPIYRSTSMPSLMSVDDLRLFFQGFCASRLTDMFNMPHNQKHFGTLAQEAVETIDFVHTNMISFVSELRDVGSLIPKLSNLKKIRNLKGLKTLSNEYLSVKYGVLPTISDLQEIVAAVERLKPYLDKNGFQTLHAGFQETLVEGNITSTMTQRVKVAISNEERGLLAVSDGLEKVGFMPNLKNIWDLVPYSFALDWFVDVGGLLESVDSRMRIATLDVKYATRSLKYEYEYKFTADPTSSLRGSIQMVHYHRMVSAHAPVPPLSFQAPLALSKHWLEASALLLQRAKF